MQLELKRIQREVGITFVFVTHDQEEALTMSDRIAVMNEGRVEQIGAPEEIYHQPASVFVAGFIGEANLCQVVGRRPATAAMRRSTSRALGSPSRRLPTRRGSATRRTLMVRPERVRVCMDQPQNGNVGLSCTVIDLVFQGRRAVRAASTDDGNEIVAHVGADEQLPMLRPGDTVWVELGARRGTPAPPVTGSRRRADRTR